MKQFEPLITPEEIVQMSEHSSRFCPTGHFAVTLEAFCKEYAAAKWGEDDPRWNKFCVLHDIFEAGRIQGIREERTRRKKTANKKGQATI